MVLRLLKNRNFIFLLALVLGLALGDKASWARHITVPALGLVMTVSMVQLPLSSMVPLKQVIKPVLWTIILNYVVFGALTLVLAKYLAPNEQIWYGFVVLASAPPGVAIAPFTGILKGNVKFSLMGVIGAYLASLVIIPLAGWWFVGSSFLDPVKLVLVLVELIIAPFIIAQVLIKLKVSSYINKWRGPLVNWGLFLIIFAVIALNRDALFSQPSILLYTLLIVGIPLFGLGFLIEFIVFKLKVKPRNRSSLVLLSNIKNGGFAAATALALFGDEASLPGAVASVLIIIYLVILTLRVKKYSQ
ncbi:MAG: hypothetical protein PHN32_04485 [Actinomycetota bacterium]|nr:hypothetical protein [Actinomycetota bacterium]